MYLSGLPPTRCDASVLRPIVLVVEDDPLVRQAVAILLEDDGFETVTAVDGVDGLRKFREIKPSLVLTDIIMPEQEGMGLIMELRRENKDVKIIAMSGSDHIGNVDFVSMAVALGANVGLHKPFDDQQLLEAARSLVGRAPRAAASGAADE